MDTILKVTKDKKTEKLSQKEIMKMQPSHVMWDQELNSGIERGHWWKNLKFEYGLQLSKYHCTNVNILVLVNVLWLHKLTLEEAE
jgi:hypothetical protein